MIIIDYKDSRPIYEQVVQKLGELMILGVLDEDSQLPSVRSLALELAINPNTIQRAYGELERGGFIYSVKGRGSFVGSINKIRAARKEDLLARLEMLAKEAKILDIDEKEFLACAKSGYDKGGAEDDKGGESDQKV